MTSHCFVYFPFGACLVFHVRIDSQRRNSLAAQTHLKEHNDAVDDDLRLSTQPFIRQHREHAPATVNTLLRPWLNLSAFTHETISAA